MGTQQHEVKIQNASMKRVGTRRDVLVMRQHVGKYHPVSSPKLVVNIGSPGMADSLMVVAVTITEEMLGKVVPVTVAAEFKTPTGRQSDAQKNWQRAFEARGGIYRLVRSPDEMEQLVTEVQSGELFRVAD